jgi:SAM-dependent methyltransferase
MRTVDGYDASTDAVAFATARFGSPTTTFRVADITDRDLPARLESPYDVVVSFDVIEHVDRYFDMAANVADLVADDGFALVGCPNRLVTFEMNHAWNPHHLQEFTPTQLRWIMSRHFEDVELVAQDLRDPARRAAVRAARGSGTWRATVKRLLPPVLKAWVRDLLARARRPVQGGYEFDDLAFDVEPGDRLDEAFGLVAVCRRPRREGLQVG